MITKFSINNFKSLQEFTIEFEKLTCLIGVNNSGKSTILQAVDLVANIAKGNVANWLKTREWDAYDIRTKSRSLKRQMLVTFSIEFILNNNKYKWAAHFNPYQLICTSELIKNTDTNNILLSLEKGKYKVNDGDIKVIDQHYEGSIISSLTSNAMGEEIDSIRNFLQKIKSLELLNPFLLRKRARFSEDDIGLGGEKLSAFLYNIDSKKRGNIYKQLGSIFENFNLFHIRAKKSGWKELWVFEKYGKDSLFTEARHVSDGFLRIIAILSQLQTGNPILLFDEIEDGVNQEVMENLVNFILESDKQVLFTTHSPMILNFLDDKIAKQSVVLVYKDKDTGFTKSCKFFEIPKINDKLNYMGPGEVFANVNLKELP